MVRTLTPHRCRACGTAYARWQGKCDECGEWSTIEAGPTPEARPAVSGGEGPVPLPRVRARVCSRRRTGVGEFDRVLGGGLVPGSVTLVAGDPGIGKSTLLLQASGGLVSDGEGKVLYVSGEESPAQTRLRAERLGIATPAILVLAETDLDRILHHAEQARPDLLVVDSIQTVHCATVTSSPGSVTQVRECAAALTAFAKANHVAVMLIGHVTKSGDIAGPRILSHVVDAVLSFEGDRYHAYRTLRAIKNRFGATEEVGLFEMNAKGLVEIECPGGLLPRESGGPGSVVVPVAEGTRILLVEVQGLVSPAGNPPPLRRVTGLDGGRLHMLLAVLAKKAGRSAAGQDVFVNAAGGVRVEEPGTDLGVLLAVASSLGDSSLPPGTVAFGEVGLLGEVRPVPRARARLAEAARLGFTTALAPKGAESPDDTLRVVTVETVADALAHLQFPVRS